MSSRAPEIEDYSNLWLFHPISHRLAKALSKTPVHPNMVSFAGAVFGVLAAINYYHYDQGNSALLAFFYMLVWHVLDGTDGQLARLTGKATTAGRAIDGMADHLVYISVYVALALALTEQMSGFVFIWALVAGASHALQASLLDRQRQVYLFWVYSGKAGGKPSRPIPPKSKFLKGLHMYFQITADYFDSSDIPRHLAYDLKIGKSGSELASAYYRKNYVNYLHTWSLVSPNAHTAAIFIFAYLGQPLYYFLFEIFAMNAIVFILLRFKKQKDAAFCDWMKNMKRK
ncbi:MAG: CDP-alcohol phosphatidyltransferase family protein [Proteobacteria bacterium]|nr:CDP-alcohol phosphatidyltransferase family protein [Pseudomonadota bacterium]